MNDFQKSLALYGITGLSFLTGYLFGKRKFENYLRKEENKRYLENEGSKHPLFKY